MGKKLQKLHLTDYKYSASFMATSLSNLVDNLVEGIQKIKCTNCTMCCFEYTNTKDDLIEHKCLCCNKNYEKKLDENFRFPNTYKSASHDIDKFILLTRKSVYPFEYMGDWGKSNETLLSKKEDFCSHSKMEGITEADDKHAKRVCKDFEINKLDKYHDLYIQSATLWLADVFDNFRYDFDMLLMIEKGIGGGICHAIHRYVKANNRYMKNFNKSKESSYFKY